MQFQNATNAANAVNAVMIVDDDPMFRMILEQVLRARGVGEVIVAQDGAVASAILDQRHAEIDAITLDLSMPNLDGVEFLRHAKVANYHGRLLLISGEHKTVLASAERLATLSGLDCLGAIAKPVDFNRIAEKLLSAKENEIAGRRAPVDIDRLVSSLKASRLAAYYQPRTNVRNGRICGAEALARIWDEDGTMLDAGEAINLAEKHGRISDITWRIVEIVMDDARRLADSGFGHLALSFNISSSILCNLQFTDQLADMVRLSGLQPTNFILELTENIIPRDPLIILEAMTRLRMAGFKLAIDDFGTGASNIEQLGMFPFTELKIDKGFVLGAANDKFARACVETSVSLARQLDLRVVAEGVEGEAELALARQFGIDEVQGFYFGKPMPFADLIAYAQDDAEQAAGYREQMLAG